MKHQTLCVIRAPWGCLATNWSECAWNIDDSWGCLVRQQEPTRTEAKMVFHFCFRFFFFCLFGLSSLTQQTGKKEELNLCLKYINHVGVTTKTPRISPHIQINHIKPNCACVCLSVCLLKAWRRKAGQGTFHCAAWTLHYENTCSQLESITMNPQRF